ncbi:hypothetical protein NIES806_08860 [Dolichospermum compactum NIES-806]|uniref:PPM-type phosphatase domain-containing protein n=1 Tax=Dolichospermum compactum NIES-806 TaxID=1973481 RepID=A0A1Z4UZS9_9CYAN|nr:hypothetical protein NIES806_08860 [Dolichospermum compactum NIES-806]
MVWKAIARSATGTSHEQQKIRCQDCGNYRIFKDVIVGAVADGAGSAKYSHFGSELAVETAASVAIALLPPERLPFRCTPSSTH